MRKDPALVGACPTNVRLRLADITKCMANLGDTQLCASCGAPAILKCIRGAIPPRLPAYYAWVCSDCGYRTPLTVVAEPEPTPHV